MCMWQFGYMSLDLHHANKWLRGYRVNLNRHIPTYSVLQVKDKLLTKMIFTLIIFVTLQIRQKVLPSAYTRALRDPFPPARQATLLAMQASVQYFPVQVCVWPHSRLYVTKCAYTHIRIYVYTHIRIYTYTHIHIYVYTHIRIHTYTYIHIYVYTHIRIHTYTYTHIYTYTHVAPHLPGIVGRRWM